MLCSVSSSPLPSSYSSSTLVISETHRKAFALVDQHLRGDVWEHLQEGWGLAGSSSSSSEGWEGVLCVCVCVCVCVCMYEATLLPPPLPATLSLNGFNVCTEEVSVMYVYMYVCMYVLLLLLLLLTDMEV